MDKVIRKLFFSLSHRRNKWKNANLPHDSLKYIYWHLFDTYSHYWLKGSIVASGKFNFLLLFSFFRPIPIGSIASVCSNAGFISCGDDLNFCFAPSSKCDGITDCPNNNFDESIQNCGKYLLDGKSFHLSVYLKLDDSLCFFFSIWFYCVSSGMEMIVFLLMNSDCSWVNFRTL